jgi:hypothetical protein
MKDNSGVEKEPHVVPSLDPPACEMVQAWVSIAHRHEHDTSPMPDFL